MTRPDLDALAALLDKATPGPWALDDYHFGWISAPSELRIASTIASSRSADDALLIVAAVNALPALLAYVRELEQEVDIGKDAYARLFRSTLDAALAMRERCAVACERVSSDCFTALSRVVALECAAAIRALEA